MPAKTARRTTKPRTTKTPVRVTTLGPELSIEGNQIVISNSTFPVTPIWDALVAEVGDPNVPEPPVAEGGSETIATVETAPLPEVQEAPEPAGDAEPEVHTAPETADA